MNDDDIPHGCMIGNWVVKEDEPEKKDDGLKIYPHDWSKQWEHKKHSSIILSKVDNYLEAIKCDDYDPSPMTCEERFPLSLSHYPIDPAILAIAEQYESEQIYRFNRFKSRKKWLLRLGSNQ